LNGRPARNGHRASTPSSPRRVSPTRRRPSRARSADGSSHDDSSSYLRAHLCGRALKECIAREHRCHQIEDGEVTANTPRKDKHPRPGTRLRDSHATTTCRAQLGCTTVESVTRFDQGVAHEAVAGASEGDLLRWLDEAQLEVSAWRSNRGSVNDFRYVRSRPSFPSSTFTVSTARRTCLRPRWLSFENTASPSPDRSIRTRAARLSWSEVTASCPSNLEAEPSQTLAQMEYLREMSAAATSESEGQKAHLDLPT
jgi:hypothetical protein